MSIQWIDITGSHQPVPDDAVVDLWLASGRVVLDVFAGDWDWSPQDDEYFGDAWTIKKYRPTRKFGGK